MKRLAVLTALSLPVVLPGGSALARGDAKPTFTPLWPEGAPGAKGTKPEDIPGIIPYLPAKDKANGSAVVICPGGGYGGLAVDHEGHQIARWLNGLGTAGIILRYRHAPYRHPIPLNDAARAVRHVRAHAEEWGIDPQRVGVMGFSAGGHLAASIGTHFDAGRMSKDPVDRKSSRPDFLILVYPVITMAPPYTHGGSRNNLLGPTPSPELVEEMSNDKRVTAETPPTFLVHTSEDTAVPPENSVLFYLALHKERVPAEMHIYEKGQHGLGLGPPGLPYSSWPGRCEAWLQGRKLLTPRPATK